MREAEQACVEGLARKRAEPGALLRVEPAGLARLARGAVERVADQRVAAIGHMDANLMRPPGGEAALDKRDISQERVQHTVARERRFRSEEHTSELQSRPH